jgi:hypothetical protein
MFLKFVSGARLFPKDQPQGVDSSETVGKQGALRLVFDTAALRA